MEVADIEVRTFKLTSLQCHSVIDFTFLEGRDNEIVKELAVADSHVNRVSSFL